MTTNDNWFRPVDLLVGPDGAVYVADWCDKRANHVDPVDNWDKTKGRIYKIQAVGAKPVTGLNLSKMSSKELLGLLSHKNDWYVHEARRILAERRDASVVPDLKKMIADNKDQLGLESLWALYVSGGFDDALADTLLNHDNEDVRTWAVRLLGDEKKVSPDLQKRLVSIARNDSSPTVRSQLACTCKRLPAKDSLPIVRELLQREEDVNDPHIPLLLWWAIEDKAVSNRDPVLGLLDSPAAWRKPITQKYIVERLARRYMAAGGDDDLKTCARLLDGAPGAAEVDLLVNGMEKALEGRFVKQVPPALAPHLARLWKDRPESLTLLRFALRLGSDDAYQGALEAHRRQQGPRRRAHWPHRNPRPDRQGRLRRPAAGAVARCHRQQGTRRHPGRPATVHGQAHSGDGPEPVPVDAGRPEGEGPGAAFRPASVGAGVPEGRGRRPHSGEGSAAGSAPARRGVQGQGPGETGREALGQGRRQTSGEKTSRIRSVAHILNQGKGDPVNGKVLFTKTCAVCHTFFGEGGKVGPELTGADRKNRDFLLTSIIDPSAFIRPEFVSYVVEMKDGRVLTGLIVEQTPDAVTLVDAKAEKTVLPRSKIDSMETSATSLMPEKLIDPLDDQEIRDLISYIQSNGPGK